MPTRTLALAAVLGLAAAVSAAEPKKKPADPLGYGAMFDAEVAKIGPITPAEFARRYRREMASCAPRSRQTSGGKTQAVSP